MGFNKEKKKKMVGLLSTRRAVAAGVGTSTCTGLVYKRQRVGEAVAPSGMVGSLQPLGITSRAPPPRATLLFMRVGEGAFEGQQMPPAPELPALLQHALERFPDKEMLESLNGNLLQDRVAYGLGDFLVASSLALSRAQESEELKARMVKLKEELALKTKAFSNRETATYQELTSFRQSEKDVKKLVFYKSHEAVQLEVKILPLHNKVVNLEEKVEGMQAKMVKLEERATQREVQLGQVEGELAEKVELFKKAKEELTNDVVDAYGEGFHDAIA